MRTLLIPVLALAAVACTPPPEAPADLGENSLFMFQHFEEADHLVAAAAVVEDYLLNDVEDLSGSPSDRAVSPPILTEEYWGGITGPSGISADDQVPVAMPGESIHGMDVALESVFETNHVCIESDTTVYYQRAFLEGEDCFPDDCAIIRTKNEIRKESFLAKVWYDSYKDFHYVELDDGRMALFARGWIDQSYPGDSGSTSWDQLYTVEAWIPRADDNTKTLRYYAMWSSVSGIDAGLYRSAVVGGLAEGMENSDAFYSNEECSNDRDAEYERP